MTNHHNLNIIMPAIYKALDKTFRFAMIKLLISPRSSAARQATVAFWFMKKAIVFIDGSNFYYRLKHIIKKGANNISLLDFNY